MILKHIFWAKVTSKAVLDCKQP